MANSFRNILVKDKTKWRSLMENYSDKITLDSSRFEMAKIPGAQKTTAKAGTITGREPRDNYPDDSAR